MRSGPYEVEEISEAGPFLSLQPEWNRILEDSACDLPFMTHDWLSLWWKHFGSGRPLSILTARREGRLVLAIPLLESRGSWLGFPFVTLRSLTNAHSFRYHVPLARGEEGSVRAAWDYLRKRPRAWHVIELERFETGYPADTELRSAARSTGHGVGVWDWGPSPRLSLEGSWKEYHASLKPKFRSNLRNRLKRLGAMGTIEYELVRDRNGCDAALEDAFRIEQAGWKGKEGSAIASDPALRRFYTEWGAVAADRGWLRLWFLRLGGRRVAFEYNLEYKRDLYCMKIGYDPELHPYSAGQILKAAILENAFEHGLGMYHFLGMMDESKGDWTSDTRLIQWAYVYNRSPLSGLHHAQKFVLRPWLKRMLGR